MLQLFQKNIRNPKSRLVGSRNKNIFIWCLLLSTLFHLLSYINFSFYAPNSFRTNRDPKKVKIQITSRLRPKDQPDELEKKQQKLLETPLAPTEKPKDPRYLSHQDHSTEKETRVREDFEQERAKNAGPKGTQTEIVQRQRREEVAKESQDKKEVQSKNSQDTLDSKQKVELMDSGDLAFDGETKKRQEKYRKMLPSKEDLQGLVDAGYQQHLDESIDLGERIDMNTGEFRFMGYFTAMRKSIELVWNYPSEAAQRGMEGEVSVEFVINKSGAVSRIRIVRSSGYKLLDDAIIDALKLASPFSPLPDGFGKDKMLVTGSFRYVLSPYVAGAH